MPVQELVYTTSESVTAMRVAKPSKVYGMSPVMFAYAFLFYTYYVWFKRQERERHATNHVSELYAWAVLSLNMSMVINIAVCSIVLLSAHAMDVWRSIAGLPKIIVFGWSYPIVLFLNYRVLFGASSWQHIYDQMDSLSNRRKSFGFAIVAVLSAVVFLGTFALAFAVM